MQQQDKPTGPRPIAETIRQFLKESGLRRPGADERVFRAWSAAAGKTWNRHAVPTAFRGGQLVVEVSSSVHLAELRGYHGEGLRAHANTSLGDEIIKKVVFKLKS